MKLWRDKAKRISTIKNNKWIKIIERERYVTKEIVQLRRIVARSVISLVWYFKSLNFHISRTTTKKRWREDKFHSCTDFFYTSSLHRKITTHTLSPTSTRQIRYNVEIIAHVQATKVGVSR